MSLKGLIDNPIDFTKPRFWGNKQMPADISTHAQLPAEAVRTASEVGLYIKTLRKEPIKNHDEYVSAAACLKQIKAKLEEVEQKRLGITRPMDLAKQRIMDLFRPATDGLKMAEIAIKNSMVAWQAEVARIAREAQDRIDEAARIEAEKAKAKLEAEAVKLVQGGKIEEATQLVAQAENIEPEAIQLAVVQPKIEGISTREIWDYEIVDESMLPRMVMIPNEKMLGEMARKFKGLRPVPGVRFFSRKVIGA